MISKCLEPRPDGRTVRLGGVAISISRLSTQTGLHPSYLSYVLAGKRSPSLDKAHSIATALGISMDEFHALRRARK